MSQALWAKRSPSNNRRNVPCRRLLSLTLSIRTASVVVSLGPLPALLTIISATLLGRQLKEVHDLSNMGRDVRLVGGVMLASFRKQQKSRRHAGKCVEHCRPVLRENVRRKGGVDYCQACHSSDTLRDLL